MRTPLWRQTPPAIFPVALGFLGLGLAWRNAGPLVGVPVEVGDLLLGLATMFFLWFGALYAMKFIKRPGVLLEDLKVPPARAGMSAMAMAVMLLAAVALQYGYAWPWLLWLGIALHVIIAALVLRVMAKAGPEGRAFSPFQYLTFVGLIVAPIAGVPLGLAQVSFWLAMVSLVAFFAISVGYGRKAMKVLPPPPLRPSLVITLAPLSLFALMFHQFHWMPGFQVFYWLAVIAAFVALFAGKWLMTDGWTPVWGAFTFPLTAFANLQAAAVKGGDARIALALLVGTLAVATPVILYIVYKAVMAWMKGELSKKSGAATA